MIERTMRMELKSNSQRRCWRMLVAMSWSTTVVAATRMTRLTWVNGVGYNLLHMEEGQQVISKLFGGKRVRFCHNPTAMSDDDDTFGYIGDLTQAGTQKLGRITQEVDTLVKHLREAVTAVGRHGRVIHIAHSQGALITSLAAKKLSPLEMNQIEVIAFGGAAALQRTPMTPFVRCINYYSVNDPLLWLVPSAAQALRSGFVGDEEFCFLAPRIGDPIGDHDLLGPTYAEALAWEGHRFCQTYQSPVYRMARTIGLLIAAVYHALATKLSEILKSILRPVIRWMLLIWTFLQFVYYELSRRFQERTLTPTIVLFVSVSEEIKQMFRSRFGRTEKYEPVLSTMNPPGNLQASP